MKRSGHIFLVGVLALGVRCFGAEGEVPYQVGVHSDSEYAHELLTLRQVEIMRQQQAAAKGTPAEEMWKSELILARWEELTKDPGNVPAVTAEYLGSLS